MAYHHTPVLTVDELCQFFEGTWADVPVSTIKSLYHSMPKSITVVIVSGGG